MLKLAVTSLVAFGLVLAGVSTAFAADGQGAHETLNIWCAPDGGAGIGIHGTLIVPSGTEGAVHLSLAEGKSPGWSNPGQQIVIQTVKGQTSYTFGFNETLDSNGFDRFRVDGDGTSSRVLSRDECGFRVPEAPSSALLLLGGLPVAGVVGMRVAGIRLPRPGWPRIG